MNLTHSKNSKTLVGVYVDEIQHENILNECLYSICEQTNPVDLVIFVNKDMSDDHKKALSKITDKPTIIMFSKDEAGNQKEEAIEATKKLNFTLLEIDSDSFPKIFNLIFNLANKSGYESFSVMEKEDAFSLKWFEVYERFRSENSEVGVFVPLMRNISNGVFNGLMNEASWAEGFSEEAGKFDINLLSRFNCVNTLGAVYDVEKVKEYSEELDSNYFPMKESIELSHGYEFFLRMIYNDLKVMTIPRIGYEIKFYAKDNFAYSSSKIPVNITEIPEDKGGISREEGRFWMELAKKEYFFDEDRKKTYETA